MKFKHDLKNKIIKINEKICDLKKLLNYKLYENEILNINKKLKKKYIYNKNDIILLNKKKKYIYENLKLFNKFDEALYKINCLNDIYNKYERHYDYIKITENINIIENIITELKYKYFFTNENDNKSCYVYINSGSGGNESKYWTNILLKMYIKWAINKKLKYTILDKNNNYINSKYKSVTLLIEGKYSYGWFKTETGIHRLVNKNFNLNKRQTSFSSVFVCPKIDNNLDIKIDNSNIKIDLCKSSGAGGQHINKTESSVKITHIPTGITTKSQKSRSQFINKDKAIKQLKNKLYNLNILKKESDKKKIYISKSEISWGNQIRSYILDDSLIKDIRTGIEIHDIKSILNGDLSIFVEESLKLKL